MHLADPVEVFPDCRLWLAYFDDESGDPVVSPEDALAEAKMSDRDQLRYQQYRPAVKKRQFLNSRRAVRSVLQRELGDTAAHVQFDSDSQGCPILVSEQIGCLPQISLSHSGNAVAVAISTHAFPIGVDIEIVEPLRAEALRQVAAHPHERAWCDQQTGRESDALATLWTIKEAVWKTLHSGGEITMAEISIEVHAGVLTSCVEHPAFKDAKFRTQLFVVECDAVAPE
ncbi:MAG: 4'-phosphopantetheinyl transferase superfamily protein, partial [Fuerstia sp.]|nr:4'-phosphopantetheinyl transferase superfamily protein [Fuerstiella sp.]